VRGQIGEVRQEITGLIEDRDKMFLSMIIIRVQLLQLLCGLVNRIWKQRIKGLVAMLREVLPL
jgi:hypothetical protein